MKEIIGLQTTFQASPVCPSAPGNKQPPSSRDLRKRAIRAYRLSGIVSRFGYKKLSSVELYRVPPFSNVPLVGPSYAMVCRESSGRRNRLHIDCRQQGFRRGLRMYMLLRRFLWLYNLSASSRPSLSERASASTPRNRAVVFIYSWHGVYAAVPTAG